MEGTLTIHITRQPFIIHIMKIILISRRYEESLYKDTLWEGYSKSNPSSFLSKVIFPREASTEYIPCPSVTLIKADH